MKRRWKGLLTGLAVALSLQVSVSADVTVDGTQVSADHGWIENGTSYITLRAYDELTEYDLSWDGAKARLTGEGLELTAVPGQLYITANERVLYVQGGVRVVDGKLTLPLRVLAQATGDILRWDADTGTAQLGRSGELAKTADYNEEDLYWLSRIISAESRGEPLLGQLAVGSVVLNRVASAKYPNTVKGVVFDRKYAVQFEPVSNGTIYHEPVPSAVLAAKMCLEGAGVVGDCLYFYAPDLSPGTWIVNHATYYTTIGCHRFYR